MRRSHRQQFQPRKLRFRGCGVSGLPVRAQLLPLPSGCRWRLGNDRDRDRLLACVCATFAEAFPQQDSWAHLVDTVDRHFDPQQAPFWWIETTPEADRACLEIGCVWACKGIGQVTGEPIAYILALWVDPAWRRRGLGTALVRAVERWADESGFAAVELQVFGQNAAARALYERLGFQVAGLWMRRSPLELRVG